VQTDDIFVYDNSNRFCLNSFEVLKWTTFLKFGAFSNAILNLRDLWRKLFDRIFGS